VCQRPQAFKDLLDVLPDADGIADENIIKGFVELDFLRVLKMKLQMRKTLSGPFDGLRVGVDTDAIGGLDCGQQIAAFTADMQDAAVGTDIVLVELFEPFVIVGVFASPLVAGGFGRLRGVCVLLHITDYPV